jgi:hypothetical protein
MTLSEDSRGLHVHVPSMDGRREEVRALASAVERGDMDEMSLAFICLTPPDQQWDAAFEHRTVAEMDIHRGDVCAVVHGANPATAGAWMGPAEQLSYRRPVAIGGPVLLVRELRASAADVADLGNPAINVADADHAPMTGTHTHPVTHEHDGDASHGTSANVMVDDTSGIPGEEVQFTAARRLELRMRELELMELAQ